MQSPHAWSAAWLVDDDHCLLLRERLRFGVFDCLRVYGAPRTSRARDTSGLQNRARVASRGNPSALLLLSRSPRQFLTAVVRGFDADGRELRVLDPGERGVPPYLSSRIAASDPRAERPSGRALPGSP